MQGVPEELRWENQTDLAPVADAVWIPLYLKPSAFLISKLPFESIIFAPVIVCALFASAVITPACVVDATGIITLSAPEVPSVSLKSPLPNFKV